MTRKQAKAELQQILSQKTVSISRLKRVLSVLDYGKMERDFINLGRNIKRMKKRLRQLEMSDK